MDAPSPERWLAIRGLFLRAVGVPADDRVDFVRREAASASVGDDVLSLLQADAASVRFAEEPAVAIGLAPPSPEAHAPSSGALGPGSSVGPFRIQRLLAEGAFGLVYVAEQQSPVRRVALKVLRPGVTSRTSVLRFQFEPEFLAALAHPGIAQVYEAGTLPAPDSRPFFAMELVEGTPITEYGRGQPIGERLRVFIEVGGAVQHAHSRGVIHRDLKPTNILVTSEGHPKLLDFGVARLVGHNGRTATPPGFPGQLVGTLAYIAPEYIGSDPVAPDVRADVYALGVILFELLSGTPFMNLGDRSIHESLLAIAHAPRPRLRTRAPGLDRDLELIVNKATDPDPTRRYGTVSDFLADIERFRTHSPISARRPTLAYELRKLASRNRLAAGLAIAGIVATAGFVGWLAVTKRESHARLEVARTTADLLLSDAMKRLGPTLGTIETRERIVRQLEEPLNRLLAIDPSDPSLRRNAIRLLQAKADIASERGQWENVESLRTSVVADLQSLAQSEPSDPTIQADLSIACVQLGDTYKATGQFERTREWYEKALALDTSLVEHDPSNAANLDNLAWSYLRLSELALHRNATVDALRFADLQLKTSRQLVGISPDRPGSRFALATALVHRHDLNAADPLRRHDTTLIDEAVAVGRDMLRAAPENRGYLHQHGLNCVKAALTRVESDHTDGAPALLAEAGLIAGQLEQAEPEAWRTLTLRTYLEYAQACLARASGLREEAVRHAASARAVAWHIIERHGTDQAAVMDAVWHVHKSLEFGELPGGADELASEHRRVRDLLERMMAVPSPHPRAMATLLSIYRQSPVPELRSPEKARDLIRRWVALQPDQPTLKLLLAEVLLESGQAAEANEIWQGIPEDARPTSGPLRDRFAR